MTPAAKQIKLDPARVFHVQPKPGKVVVIGGLAFGDRATPQVPGSAITPALLEVADIVDPTRLPDAADR